MLIPLIPLLQRTVLYFSSFHSLCLQAMDSAAAAPPPANEEEMRRRRSTDCIYHLAYPLTGKKGSECEYRHSDAAWVNPRDCWYWFNDNCANPKCSFRHLVSEPVGIGQTSLVSQSPLQKTCIQYHWTLQPMIYSFVVLSGLVRLLRNPVVGCLNIMGNF